MDDEWRDAATRSSDATGGVEERRDGERRAKDLPFEQKTARFCPLVSRFFGSLETRNREERTRNGWTADGWELCSN
uniref:Uncharacterized protein n=1 Tax=Caenorhabditis tropicalis TaxID=1561998 RepID=A0A1I7TVJ8_9PELO